MPRLRGEPNARGLPSDANQARRDLYQMAEQDFDGVGKA